MKKHGILRGEWAEFNNPERENDGPQPERSGDSRRQITPMILMITDLQKIGTSPAR
jgi:hypothetical protein